MSRNGWKFEDTIKKIALENGMRISDCKKIFDSFIDEFSNAFIKGEKVSIPRFGTIYQDRSGYHFAPTNSLLKGMKNIDN